MQETDQLSLADPSRVAIICGDSKITYSRFAQDVGDCATWLSTQGFAAGKRVGIFLRQPYWEWVANLAAMRLGLSVVALTSNHAEEIPAVGGIDVWLGESPTRTQVCMAFSPEGMAPLREQLDVGGPLPEVSHPSQRFMTTSGTTGRTRAVLWTDDVTRKTVRILRESLGIHTDSVVLTLLAMSTVPGFRYQMAAWQVGGCVLLREPVPDSEHSLLTRKSIAASTFLAASPQSLMTILASFPEPWRGRDGRRIVVPGGRLPIAVRNHALQIACRQILVSYGSTEVGSIAAGDSLLLDRHPGAVGHVLAEATIEIVDSSGAAVPAGQPGIVRTRSTYMSRRYETVEDTTTSAFRDGWFYSGDEGILFADGLFAIAGRISETFNLMGLKVSISDLETELLQTRLVKDVAAVMIELKGVDHLAFAVICDSREDALALGRRARRRIPSGVPVRVARVRDIPRNAMGKVMRPALKAQLSEFFARAGARKAKTSSY